VAGQLPRTIGLASLQRTGLRVGLASLVLIAASARSVHDATADNDTRTLSFHHTHSDEDLTVTFKRNGRYDEAALKKLNHFLRDWRSQDETTMERRLFDIIWEVYRDVDGKEPIQIISAYRSPGTNAMLRRRSSGVARNSQHMQGHAMDFFIPGIPLEQIRFAGLRLQRGGVGFYPTSGSPFVHLDAGGIRHWPRMTHDQLASVFPDGRTVHIPSDGKPLARYDLALADIEKRGDGSDEPSTSNKPGFFASLLFHKHTDDEEESGADTAPAKPGLKAEVAAVAAKVEAKVEKVAEIVPLPRAKPAAAKPYQVASAELQTAALARASEPRPQTPIDIINARGFWDNEPAPKPTSVQAAVQKARNVVASTDPLQTASLSQSDLVRAKLSEAMAYAPVSQPVDRSKIAASSAPISGNGETILVKATRGTADTVRIARWEMNEIWLRAMVLAPSVSRSLSASLLGDQDMTVMKAHFVKPKSSVAMTFSDDPQMGIICERFTGSATAILQTTSFTMRTASLR
jgi:uncharacterized protein YcbK (DUF882 family)